MKHIDSNNQLTVLETKLTKIANKHIPELANRKSLQAYYSDEDDFFETSVWSLEEALKAAYELGKNER
jgi:hypothetical protein